MFGSLWNKSGIAKPCTHPHAVQFTSTHLHPTPSTSPQQILTSTNLHQSSINLHPSLISMLLKLKHRMQLSHFPKFRPKNSKLSVLTENLNTWYLGGADSEFGLNFWNSESIFGQIWAEKVKNVCFAWKLAPTVSRRCWFLFRH